jgi:hypothetical protein
VRFTDSPTPRFKRLNRYNPRRVIGAVPDNLPFGAEIGGYDVTAEPAIGVTAFAIAPGNRPLVLKALDPDCLLQAGAKPKLHASIRDRLARVRELAYGRVANLYGVERDRGKAYLVWEYVPGSTLESWAMRKDVSPRELLLMARELILTVEALHSRGIVHGAIHGRNVFVDAPGKLKLTHVSPLLYTDPQQDLKCIAEMLHDLARQRGEGSFELESLAAEAEESDGTLRSMMTRASSLIEQRRDEESDALAREADARRRRRSRIAAAVMVLIALGLSYGIRRYVNEHTARPFTPPEAPASAVE